jgi:integrase/recombinase XerD
LSFDFMCLIFLLFGADLGAGFGCTKNCTMANIFQRAGSEIWTAKFKVWDAGLGRHRWLMRSTGCVDRGQAARVAAGFEAAANAAEAGSLTREKVRDTVNEILRLAGLDTSAVAPSLLAVGEAWVAARERQVASGTARKYRAQWDRLRRWAGKRAEMPVDRWRQAEMQAYYDDLVANFSGTTANDHWATVRRLFARAMKEGHLAGDPTALVEAGGSASMRKEPLARGEVAAAVRAMRRGGRLDWAALTLLGWHTGHRLADLLALRPEDFRLAPGIGWTVSIRPAKKSRQGGREVVLPLPSWLALLAIRTPMDKLGGDNRSGKVSARFVAWLEAAGVDPMPVERGVRRMTLKSFHSLRHSMASRLASAGVSGELARLVTDHDSPQVARGYVHAEVAALAEALRRVRRR